MTSFAQKYNKGNVNPFELDLKGYTFTSLKELYNADKSKVHSINGLYFTRGKFGVHVVIVMNDLKKLVDMPVNLTNLFNDIVRDDDAVKDIKGGKVGIKIRKYESHNKECYTISFIDK